MTDRKKVNFVLFTDQIAFLRESAARQRTSITFALRNILDKQMKKEGYGKNKLGISGSDATQNQR